MGPAYGDGYKHSKCPYPSPENLPSIAELDAWDRIVEEGGTVHEQAPEVASD